MTMRRLQSLALGLVCAVMAFSPGAASPANFTLPAKELAAAFKPATGHTAILSFGSSGQFYAQMSHGAPYEVFLSADADRPLAAERDGLGVTGSRFTYAVGRLVLFSK